MASFLDTFFKIILLATQIISVVAIGRFSDKIKLSSVEKVKELGDTYEKNLKKFMKGNNHEDIGELSTRYTENLRSAQRSLRFWNGKVPTLFILLFIFIQIIIFTAYFDLDLAPGWR